MYKVIVITDAETADGFRLAGCRRARGRLARGGAKHARVAASTTTTSGIIAVNEHLMAAIDERLQKKIDSIYRPIVISLPIREKLQVGEDHRAYLSRLIRRAIGFDITLRRG